MNSYLLFLYFILTVKCIFAFSITLELVNVATSKFFSKEFMEKNDEIQEKLKNLYFFLMAIMLIIIFRNRSKSSIKFMSLELELLYLFGLVLSFKLFFAWLKKLKKKLGRTNDNSNIDIAHNAIDVTADVFIPLA